MKTLFVSSTFKDMQHERDIIRDQVCPEVNRVARKYGQSIDFCDLRWGISTEQMPEDAASIKIMDVCLDEIDRSSNPMIVLIGERYGWIPDAALMNRVAASHGFSLGSAIPSATELEILFGAFRRRKNTIFLFRHIVDSSSGGKGLRGLFGSRQNKLPSIYRSEDELHAARLGELKRRISQTFSPNIQSYTLEWDGSGFTSESLAAFSKQLSGSLIRMLEPDWKNTKNRTPLQKQLQEQWTFIYEKSELFSARKKEANAICAGLAEIDVPLIIKGDPGIGKSSLFCYTARALAQQKWMVLPFICGLNSETSDAASIMHLAVEWLEQTTGPIPGREDMELPDLYRKALTEYAKTGNRLVLMMDGVDQLFADEYRDNLVFIPENIGPKIKFIMTSQTKFVTAGRQFLTLDPLGREDQLEVIRTLLARHHKTDFQRATLEAILARPQAGNPLYLSALVLRLVIIDLYDYAIINRQGGADDAIAARHVDIIRSCPPTIEAMYVELFREVGQRINPDLTRAVMCYLAATRYGLRSLDLAALLGKMWNPLDFAHLINYISECFMLRSDGRYDFMHSSIRQGWEKSVTGQVHEILFSYMQQLPADDDIRQKEFLYHCMTANRRTTFVEYVDDILETEDDEQFSILFSGAAGCVKDFCLRDGGEWIVEELDGLTRHSDYYGNVCLFLDEALMSGGTGLLGNHQMRVILCRIMEAGLPLREKMIGPGNLLRQQDYYEALNILANLYMTTGNVKGYQSCQRKIREATQAQKQSHAGFGEYSAYEIFDSEVQEAMLSGVNGSAEDVRKSIELIESKLADINDTRIPIEKIKFLQEREGKDDYELAKKVAVENRRRNFQHHGESLHNAYVALGLLSMLHAIRCGKTGMDPDLCQDSDRLWALLPAMKEGIALAEPDEDASQEEKKAYLVLRKLREADYYMVCLEYQLVISRVLEFRELDKEEEYALKGIRLLESLSIRDLGNELSVMNMQRNLHTFYTYLESTYTAAGDLEKARWAAGRKEAILAASGGEIFRAGDAIKQAKK